MKLSQRTARQIACRSTQGSICTACQKAILRRRYTSAAAAVEANDSHSDQSLSSLHGSAQALRPLYRIQAGVVLSRPPQITRDLTGFEKAYFLYQRRLNERLALPFTKYFYFKKGTPAELEWKRKVQQRLTAARDIGNFNPFLANGWNDELLVGAKESEPGHQYDALLNDAENSGPAEEGDAVDTTTKKDVVERPMPRLTEADHRGDQRNLNRLLQRSLYLLVKDVSGRWTFPSALLPRGEKLRQAAERIMIEAGGENMNTWIVGNAPIGYYRYDLPQALVEESSKTEELGEKVFFMKARIMAGQFSLGSNKLGLSDFKWLSKEEIQGLVTSKYWSMTRDMLADR